MTDFGINEYFIFLIYFLLGIVFGFILYSVLKIKNKIIGGSFQTIFAIACVFIFFIFSLRFSYGLFSVNMFIGVFIGGILGYALLGKLFGKVFLVCYNLLVKFSRQLDKIVVIRRKHGKSKTKVNT